MIIPMTCLRTKIHLEICNDLYISNIANFLGEVIYLLSDFVSIEYLNLNMFCQMAPHLKVNQQ